MHTVGQGLRAARALDAVGVGVVQAVEDEGDLLAVPGQALAGGGGGGGPGEVVEPRAGSGHRVGAAQAGPGEHRQAEQAVGDDLPDLQLLIAVELGVVGVEGRHEPGVQARLRQQVVGAPPPICWPSVRPSAVISWRTPPASRGIRAPAPARTASRVSAGRMSPSTTGPKVRDILTGRWM